MSSGSSIWSMYFFRRSFSRVGSGTGTKRYARRPPESCSSIRSRPSSDGLDRIEVQLSGGRRAYLFVPVPLPTREKERLKKYIDQILEPDDINSGNGNE